MTWNEATYGDAIADAYDDLYADVDPSEAVATLADLAKGGSVLELAIGTGRVALPLVARGLHVEGIDGSEAMLARLRAKPGAGVIKTVRGDFADVAVDGPFALVFIVFNTFFALMTQDDQVRCFQNVAAKLAPGGVFALEAFVPDLGRFTRGKLLQPVHVDADRVVVEASEHHRATQTIHTQLMVHRESGMRLLPLKLRYAYPSELDLMAKLAGLRLRDRWANWRRDAFGSASAAHVSVYERY